jgi:hypothetical protein
MRSRPRNSHSPLRACCAITYQEGERAKKMENPTTRGPIEATARRYAALAEKFETVRRHSNTARA